MTQVTRRIGALGIALMTLTAIAAAQESDRQEPASELERAFGRLQGAKTFVVKGAASKKEPASLATTMVMSGSGVEPASPFEGDVEVWKRPEETIVCSKEKIPGFVIYQGQGHNIAQVTFEKSPYDLRKLETDLSVLLDFEKLGEAVSEVEIQSREEKETGNRLFLVTLPGTLVPEDTGPMARLRPRVLRIESTFTLDSGGRLVQAYFDVVRSDPMAGLQRRALSGQSGSFTFSTNDLSELDGSTEGTRWIYDLDFTAKEPSRRIERAQKAIAALLLPDEF